MDYKNRFLHVYNKAKNTIKMNYTTKQFDSSIVINIFYFNTVIILMVLLAI
jgi:hypothetical protein